MTTRSLITRLNRLNNITAKVCDIQGFKPIEASFNNLTLIVPEFMLGDNPVLTRDSFKVLTQSVLTFLKVQITLAKF